MFSIDVDIGGTFTDGFFSDGERVHTAKVLTTPYDVTDGFMSCVAVGSADIGLQLTELLRRTSIVRVSTTIGTNLLVQRAGPKVALLVTKGHETDLYGEGRARILDLYVPSDMIIGVTEHVDEQGCVRREPDQDQVLAAIRRLVEAGARMIVVSLRNSWRNNHNERLIRSHVRDRYPPHYLRSVPLQVGTEVMHIADDHARTNSAVLNAYIHTDMVRALYRAEDRLRTAGYVRPLLVVQANGGTTRVAKTVALTTLHSGPAMAAKGAAFLSELTGQRRVVSADMGGTSFDIAVVVDRHVEMSSTPTIENISIGMPMITIESIGAGGGSIARVSGGRLTVGPDSAGAIPGPVCYGKGGAEPTVTDANVILGYIDPDYFLGGRMRLDQSGARRAMERRIGRHLDMSAEEAAFEIRQAIDAHMANEIAQRLQDRGVDAKEFWLFSVGGAGPLHACTIADRVGIRKIAAFPFGSVFSAFGGSTTDVQHLYTRTIGAKLNGIADLDSILEQLRKQALTDMRGEGFEGPRVRLSLQVELRTGTSKKSLTLSAPAHGLKAAIVKAAGSAAAGAWLETLRLMAECKVPHWKPRGARPAKAMKVKAKGLRKVHWQQGGNLETAIYDRSTLGVGNKLDGPVIVEGVDTNYPVPPGWSLSVDAFANFIIERRG